MNTLATNKAIVTRFNREVIEAGNPQSFTELVAAECINRAAPAGTPNGKEGMRHFLLEILRPAFPDIKVTIHDQIAEEDLVVTRKSLIGTQTGIFMGIPPTHKQVVIEVIDIIRIHKGQYLEHWAAHNIDSIMTELKAG